MSRGRRKVYPIVAGLAMCDALHRMFSDARPIDWVIVVIDFLVLVAILWLEGGEQWKRKREKARLDLIVAELAGFMDHGQQLRRNIPTPAATDKGKVDYQWIIAVNQWSLNAEAYLDNHSVARRASAYFSLVVATAEPTIYVDGGSFTVRGQTCEPYQHLVSRLDNLRKIMEKPEVYF